MSPHRVYSVLREMQFVLVGYAEFERVIRRRLVASTDLAQQIMSHHACTESLKQFVSRVLGLGQPAGGRMFAEVDALGHEGVRASFSCLWSVPAGDHASESQLLWRFEDAVFSQRRNAEQFIVDLLDGSGMTAGACSILLSKLCRDSMYPFADDQVNYRFNAVVRTIPDERIRNRLDETSNMPFYFICFSKVRWSLQDDHFGRLLGATSSDTHPALRALRHAALVRGFDSGVLEKAWELTRGELRPDQFVGVMPSIEIDRAILKWIMTLDGTLEQVVWFVGSVDLISSSLKSLYDM